MWGNEEMASRSAMYVVSQVSVSCSRRDVTAVLQSTLSESKLSTHVVHPIRGEDPDLDSLDSELCFN